MLNQKKINQPLTYIFNYLKKYYLLLLFLTITSLHIYYSLHTIKQNLSPLEKKIIIDNRTQYLSIAKKKYTPQEQRDSLQKLFTQKEFIIKELFLSFRVEDGHNFYYKGLKINNNDTF